jgi:uncharacterized membrane protein HdeD (DUF308 family)
MFDAIESKWWLLALHGLSALVFGVLAIVWPDITVFVLVIFFGAFALIDGIAAVILAMSLGRTLVQSWPLLVQGALSMIIGVIALLWPDITTLALLYVMAFWLMFGGALQIYAAYRLRHEINREWLVGLSGVLAIVAGVVLIVFPIGAIVTLGIIIGVYAILYGITLLGRAFQARSQRESQPTIGERTTQTS